MTSYYGTDDANEALRLLLENSGKGIPTPRILEMAGYRDAGVRMGIVQVVRTADEGDDALINRFIDQFERETSLEYLRQRSDSKQNLLSVDDLENAVVLITHRVGFNTPSPSDWSKLSLLTLFREELRFRQGYLVVLYQIAAAAARSEAGEETATEIKAKQDELLLELMLQWFLEVRQAEQKFDDLFYRHPGTLRTYLERDEYQAVGEIIRLTRTLGRRINLVHLLEHELGVAHFSEEVRVGVQMVGIERESFERWWKEDSEKATLAVSRKLQASSSFYLAPLSDGLKLSASLLLGGIISPQFILLSFILISQYGDIISKWFK